MFYWKKILKQSANEITLDKTFENKDNDIQYIFDAFFILNENEEINNTNKFKSNINWRWI